MVNIVPEGYRKFLFFVASLLAIYLGMMTGNLPADVFQSCFWAVMLGFGGGNVGEHVAKHLK